LRFKLQLSCLCAVVLTPALAWAAAARTPPAQTLTTTLNGARAPLSIQNNKLVGPGSTDLVRRARVAQFVLVGEDHGFADIPEFVIALKQTLGADAPGYLVAEMGPLSAAHLTQALQHGAADSVELQYPSEVPFFGWRDDLAMLEAWQKGSALRSIWGIDQEFILSSRMHLERLSALAPPAGRAIVQPYLTRAVEADRALVTERNPNAVLLPQLNDADFRLLRTAFDTPTPPEAAEILSELAESADIYRGQSQNGYDSNAQRALLMKRHFMAYYKEAAQRDGRAPRALFRIGAFHAGRGLSPINQFDIGNLASELAVSNGAASLHILIIVRRGHVNKWLPFLADASLRNSSYNAHSELAQIGAVPFLDHALDGAWTVFDMTPLRHSAQARKAGGDLFEHLVFAYDYVVVVPDGHAAVNLPTK
jgi:hypothetical protein